jgi:hypothetical protein
VAYSYFALIFFFFLTGGKISIHSVNDFADKH